MHAKTTIKKTTAITMPAIAPAERPLSIGFGVDVTVGLVERVGDRLRISKLFGSAVMFFPSQSVITNAPLSTKV